MDCLFCKIAKKQVESLILYEDDLAMVIMDKFPALDGHVLIIPKKHYETYQDLDSKILNHIHKISKEIGPKLMTKLDKSGLTILHNYGTRQIIKHYHMHLLPGFPANCPQEIVKDINKIYKLLKEE